MDADRSMVLVEYYGALRQELILHVTGSATGCDGCRWNEETPTSVLHQNLSDAFDRYVALAAPYGLHILTRHGPCGNPMHDKRARDGFVMDCVDDIPIEFQDRRFVWSGEMFFSGNRVCTCPCSKENVPSAHQVVDDIVYDVMGDQVACKDIAGILLDIYRAISVTTDRYPRSEGRQYLLRAMIKVNEAIAPIPMDLYVRNLFQLAGVKRRR